MDEEREIQEIKAKIEGVPQRLSNVEARIEELSKNINEFIRELRKGYVTKETCGLCRDKMSKEAADLKEQYAEVKALVWRVVGGIAATLAAIVLAKLKLL